VLVEKTSCDISVLPGDGIGPELTDEVVKVLDTAQHNFNGSPGRMKK
jgi:isocitrate/isopropylmalate dehydrogenase